MEGDVPNETSAFTVRRVLAVSNAEILQLAAVLIDCVNGGASVSH